MLQYDELYSSGIQAYFDGDWKKCVDNLEESIKLYRYKEILTIYHKFICCNYFETYFLGITTLF